MPIEVDVGDTVVEFPDGTPPDTIKAALRKKFPPKATEFSPTGKLAYAVGPSIGSLAGLDDAGSSNLSKALAAIGGAAENVTTGTPLDAMNPAKLAAMLSGVGKGALGTIAGTAKLESSAKDYLTGLLPESAQPYVRAADSQNRMVRDLAQEPAKFAGEAVGQVEKAGKTTEQLAEFLLPQAAGLKIARVPGLVNALARTGLGAAEFAGIGAAQRGDTEHAVRDAVLGAALPGSEVLARGASSVGLPLVEGGAKLASKYSPELVRLVQMAIGGASGGLGGMALGGMRNAPGVVPFVRKASSALAKGVGEGSTLKNALEAVAEKGPEGVAGDALGALVARIRGTGAAGAEAATAGAATPKAAVGDATVEKVAAEGGESGTEALPGFLQPGKESDELFSKLRQATAEREAMGAAPAAESATAETGSLAQQLAKPAEAPAAAAEASWPGVSGGSRSPDWVKPSLEKDPEAAALLAELLSAEPQMLAKTRVPILPDGQRAMPGGRGGTAVSPEPPKPALTNNPEAASELEQLLGALVSKPAKKARIRRSASGKSD